MHHSEEQIEEARALVCRPKQSWSVSNIGVLLLQSLDLNEQPHGVVIHDQEPINPDHT